jgi:hypothetical protein
MISPFFFWPSLARIGYKIRIILPYSVFTFLFPKFTPLFPVHPNPPLFSQKIKELAFEPALCI